MKTLIVSEGKHERGGALETLVCRLAPRELECDQDCAPDQEVADDPPLAPAAGPARVGKEHHPGPHEKEEPGGCRMGDQPCDEWESAVEAGHVEPVFPGRVCLGDEEVGVIQRHHHNDETS